VIAHFVVVVPYVARDPRHGPWLTGQQPFVVAGQPEEMAALQWTRIVSSLAKGKKPRTKTYGRLMMLES
jgi:hypothetical protein